MLPRAKTMCNSCSISKIGPLQWPERRASTNSGDRSSICASDLFTKSSRSESQDWSYPSPPPSAAGPSRFNLHDLLLSALMCSRGGGVSPRRSASSRQSDSGAKHQLDDGRERFRQELWRLWQVCSREGRDEHHRSRAQVGCQSWSIALPT